MQPGNGIEQLPEKDSATGRQAGKDYIMKNIEATKISEALRSADTWDMGLARELCALAGMADAFDAADGETFESVIYAAADKLGVEVI